MSSREEESRRNKFNVFFYDGPHSQLDHKFAFTKYAEFLADTLIFIVDDFNQRRVREGTREGIIANGNFEIIFELVIDSRWNGDTAGWWDGEGIFVLRRKGSSDTAELELHNLNMMRVENVDNTGTESTTIAKRARSHKDLIRPILHIVSFPRSGHTLLTNLLNEIFSRHQLPFVYCENYINNDDQEICNDRPNVIKSHDFDLTKIIENDAKYVVLYRGELKFQLEAVFRWLCTKKLGCPTSMRDFMDNWSTYYFLFKVSGPSSILPQREKQNSNANMSNTNTTQTPRTTEQVARQDVL